MSETLPEIPGEVAGLGRRLAALAVDWLVSIGVSLLLFRDVEPMGRWRVPWPS